MTRWIGGDGGSPTTPEPLVQGSVVAFSTSTSDGVVNTKTGCNFGTAHPRRFIGSVVTIHGTDSVSFPNFDYMKIGGVTATIAENYLVRGGGRFLWIVIGMALVPTDSNLTFEWATDSLLNTSATRNGCALYRCKFLKSSSPTDHKTATNSSDTTPVSTTLNLNPRGIILAGAMSDIGNSETPGWSWSGVTDTGRIGIQANSWWSFAGHGYQDAGNASYPVSIQVTNARTHTLAVATFR